MSLKLEQYYTGKHRRYLMQAMQYLNNCQNINFDTVYQMGSYVWFQEAAQCLIGNHNPDAIIGPNTEADPLRIGGTLRDDFMRYWTKVGPTVTAYERNYNHCLLVDRLKEVLNTNMVPGRVLVIVSDELKEHIRSAHPELPSQPIDLTEFNGGHPTKLHYQQPTKCLVWAKDSTQQCDIFVPTGGDVIWKDYCFAGMVVYVDLDSNCNILKSRDYAHPVTPT